MRLRALWRSERGATAIEFALVAPCVIILLLSIVEVGVLSFVAACLDNAVASAARTVRTGQTDGPNTAQAFETSICGMMPEGLEACRGKLTISVRQFASFANVTSAANAPPGGEFSRGAAGDIMLVKATYRWPLLTPFMSRLYQPAGAGEVLLDARLTFRNEPYS